MSVDLFLVCNSWSGLVLPQLASILATLPGVRRNQPRNKKHMHLTTVLTTATCILSSSVAILLKYATTFPCTALNSGQYHIDFDFYCKKKAFQRIIDHFLQTSGFLISDQLFFFSSHVLWIVCIPMGKNWIFNSASEGPGLFLFFFFMKNKIQCL